MKFKKLLIVFLCLCIIGFGSIANSLYSSSRHMNANTVIKGIKVTEDVIGTIGSELPYTYIVLEPTGDYQFDPSITVDDITINLEGGLTKSISTPPGPFEIDVDIMGTSNCEIIKDLVVEIPGEFVIDYNTSLPMTGYTFTNSEDSTSCFMVEPVGPASAMLSENKSYIFKTGEAVEKDLIEVKITNESLSPLNVYAPGSVFMEDVYNGLSLKVDSVIQTGCYFKTFKLYLDGTPNAAGEKVIDDLKIPSDHTINNVGDLNISGSITIKINDPYIPSPPYIPPVDEDINVK